MSWEVVDDKLQVEWGRLTWRAKVRNNNPTSRSAEAIPADGKFHDVELKYLERQGGVAPWYSLLVDRGVVAESGTGLNTWQWQGAALSMLLDSILGVGDDFDDLLS